MKQKHENGPTYILYYSICRKAALRLILVIINNIGLALLVMELQCHHLNHNYIILPVVSTSKVIARLILENKTPEKIHRKQRTKAGSDAVEDLSGFYTQAFECVTWSV